VNSTKEAYFFLVSTEVTVDRHTDKSSPRMIGRQCEGWGSAEKSLNSDWLFFFKRRQLVEDAAPLA
jgi:hypothetical protein